MCASSRTFTAVECQWTDGRWYAAVITGRGNDGGTIDARYVDDGVNQRTNTGDAGRTDRTGPGTVRFQPIDPR